MWYFHLISVQESVKSVLEALICGRVVGPRSYGIDFELLIVACETKRRGGICPPRREKEGAGRIQFQSTLLCLKRLT